MGKNIKDIYLDLKERTMGGEILEEKDFKEFAELSVYYLIESSDPFFGRFLMQMSRNIDPKLPAPAAVSVTNLGFVLHLNPNMLMSFEFKEIIAILIHEIYHIVNNHLYRIKNHTNIEIDYINIAMDASINQYIDNLPETTITPESIESMFNLNYKLELNREYEYYLEAILNSNHYDEIEKLKSKLRKAMKELEDRAQENGGISGKDIDEVLESNGLDVGDLTMNHPDIEGDKSKTIPEEAFKGMIKELTDEAMNQSRGTAPLGLEKAILELDKKPMVSWQDKFKQMVGSISVPYKRTFLRLNRRMPNRRDIRGRMMDKEINLAVAIDTSGSQSVEQLSYIFNEISHMLKGIKHKLTIIEADSEVQRVYQVRNKNDIDYNILGGGGTRLSPVIELMNDKKGKSKPDLLIYFTDGYAEQNLTEHPRGYKVMWVLIDGSTEISLKEPYGPVLLLNTEDH